MAQSGLVIQAYCWSVKQKTKESKLSHSENCKGFMNFGVEFG